MDDATSAHNELVDKAAADMKDKDQGGDKNTNDNKDDNKDTGSAAGDDKDKGADDKGANPKDERPDPLADLLKDTDFETIDALKAHLKGNKKAQKSPEEVKRESEVYRANLNQFAVESELMTNEDIVKLETLKQKADKDLVFDKFAGEVREEIEADLKAENPDATQAEIDEKIKEAFESEFPLESKNEKTKARAQAKLTREAKEIRGPLESSFTQAKTRYDKEVEIRNAYPEFKKSVTKMVADSVPDSVPFYSEKEGDNDVPVNVKISPEKKKEISDALTKKMLTSEVYELQAQGKHKEVAAIMEEEKDRLVWKHMGEEGKKEIAKTFRSRGLDKGSNTGAKNSFSTNQSGQGSDKKIPDVDAKQAAIDSTRQKP